MSSCEPLRQGTDLEGQVLLQERRPAFRGELGSFESQSDPHGLVASWRSSQEPPLHIVQVDEGNEAFKLVRQICEKRDVPLLRLAVLSCSTLPHFF